MTTFVEAGLRFTFPDSTNVAKYDDWSFYRNQFQSTCGGSKGVDFAYEDGNQLWLIEVKDYSRHPRKKCIEIGEEFALKVRDSLAGLLAARANANDVAERQVAGLLLRRRRFRAVLHLEQPACISKLFPKPIDASKLTMKLRQLLKAIDAHPIISDRKNLHPDFTWTVERET